MKTRRMNNVTVRLPTIDSLPAAVNNLCTTFYSPVIHGSPDPPGRRKSLPRVSLEAQPLAPGQVNKLPRV